MALRLRRGTNAERGLITPKAGELIYTTDTKALYIGDGTTVGGVIVQGAAGATTLNDLTDVTLGSITNGQVLSYNAASSSWVASNQTSIAFGKANAHTDISYGPDNTAYQGDILLHDGSNWQAVAFLDSQTRISVVGADSTLIVDHVNSKLNGELTGNVIGNIKGDVTNDNGLVLNSTTKTLSGVKLLANNGTTAYDPTLRHFFGDFKGNAQMDIYSSDNSGIVKLLDHTAKVLNDTDISGGNIMNKDSSIIVDAQTSKVFAELTGNVIGNVTGNTVGFHTGDSKGSVFGDDSTLLVDGVNGRFVGPVVSESVQSRNVKLGSAADPNTIYLVQNGTGSNFIISTEASAGSVQIPRNTLIGSSNVAVGSKTVRIYNDTATEGTIPVSIMHAHNGTTGSSMGVLRARGTKAVPLTVAIGDTLGGFGTAGYNGSAYKGASGIRSVVDQAPQSTHIPASIQMYNTKSDGTQQVVLSIGTVDSTAAFTGPVKLPVFADDAARNTAVSNAQNGMIIYQTDVHKFKGYANGAWVDLH
jgi:hypothetical protein|tara:strand:- start:387 stop:1976 length:1590 start_codon:yes stop_codon:yes gene_type:complete